MPRRRLTHDFAGARVERGIERQRAVPVVLESVAFGAAGREREHGIEPVERLNRGFFVEAEDGRVLRRGEVQPDDVGGLHFKRRVGRPHIALEAMWLETGALPCALYKRMTTQLEGRREFA